MTRFSRRKLLKASGLTTAGVAVPGVASATQRNGNSQRTTSQLRLADLTTIVDDGQETVAGVSLVEVDRYGDEVDRHRQIVTHDEESLDTSLTYVQADTYDTMTSPRISTMDAEGVKTQLAEIASDPDDREYVERSDSWGWETGSCGVHGGYDHKYRGATVEFTKSTMDIGWTTVSGVLALLVGSAFAPVVVAIGGYGALTGTDSVTIGAHDYDLNYLLGKKTMYSVAGRSGWKVKRGKLLPLSTGTYHPARPR